MKITDIYTLLFLLKMVIQLKQRTFPTCVRLCLISSVQFNRGPRTSMFGRKTLCLFMYGMLSNYAICSFQPMHLRRQRIYIEITKRLRCFSTFVSIYTHSTNRTMPLLSAAVIQHVRSHDVCIIGAPTSPSS